MSYDAVFHLTVVEPLLFLVFTNHPSVSPFSLQITYQYDFKMQVEEDMFTLNALAS